MRSRDKEIEELKGQIANLELKQEVLERHFWETSENVTKYIKNCIDSYFEEKCRVVMIKRDKDEIVAQLKKRAIDNMFRKDDD